MDLRSITTGIVKRSRCDWSGKIEISILGLHQHQLGNSKSGARLRLGEPLKQLQIPETIVGTILEAVQGSSAAAAAKREAEQKHLGVRLSSIRRRVDQAYNDKLDGKITEDFWERKNADWRTEEQGVRIAMASLPDAASSDRTMDVARILELANKAYLLYKTQNSFEQAKLLRMLVSNCSVDAVTVRFESRKTLDLVF